MRCLAVILALACGQWALADEATDRSSIAALISALNSRSGVSTDLFTGDSGDSRQQMIRVLQTSDANQPFSELTEPRLVVRSIQFITPVIALVDATSDQYGSTLPVRKLPVLLIVRKDAGWRVAAVRVFPSVSDPPLRK